MFEQFDDPADPSSRASGRRLDRTIYQPEIGCLLLVIFFCFFSFLAISAWDAALQKLELTPTAAILVTLGIFLGGAFNIPVYRIEREAEQPAAMGLVRFMGWTPMMGRQKTQTLIAVNFGGCITPLIVVIYEMSIVASHSSSALWALLIAALVNISACYAAARPIAGIGIAMPAFLSPLVSVGVTWLLTLLFDIQPVTAPIAFTAGVLGPLVGADLFHLRDITRVSVGMLSIGGAGTFDGIVISGMAAAFLA